MPDIAPAPAPTIRTPPKSARMDAILQSAEQRAAWSRVTRAQKSLDDALGRYPSSRSEKNPQVAQAMLFTAIVASKALTEALKSLEVAQREGADGQPRPD